VVIPLIGGFKTEVGEHFHPLPVAAVTASGFEARKMAGTGAEMASGKRDRVGSGFQGEGD